jgi:hypothetical protein
MITLPKSVMSKIPVTGSIYGFGTTAMKVYNSTSVEDAIFSACKGIVVDCTPPAFKYPVLCAALALSSVGCVTTGGNPYVVSSTLQIARVIIES